MFRPNESKFLNSTGFGQNFGAAELQERTRDSYFLFSTDETLKFLKFGICHDSRKDRSYCLGSVKGQLWPILTDGDLLVKLGIDWYGRWNGKWTSFRCLWNKNYLAWLVRFNQIHLLLTIELMKLCPILFTIHSYTIHFSPS